jgi:hypothetical protein
MNRQTKDRRGATLVLFMLSIVLILGFAGLTIDVGHWYHTQTHLQSCSDAAALAGCTKLPDGNAAVTVARSYLTSNFVDSSEISVCRALPTSSSNPNEFEVVLLRKAGPFFTAALGVGQVTIGTRSLAVAATSGSGGSGKSGDLSGFGFAIYSGQEFTSKGKVANNRLSGSGLKINGDIDVNGDFTVTGSNTTINGTVNAGHSISIGNGDSANAQNPNAPIVSMPQVDLDSVKATAKAAGTYYQLTTSGKTSQLQVWNPTSGAFVNATAPLGASIDGGDLHFPNSKTGISGTYYLDGMGIKIDGSSLDGTATFVSTGDIHVSGTGLNFTSTSKFGFVSTGGDLHFSGSNSTLYGAWVATNGSVALDGSGVTINGAVITNSLENDANGKVGAGHDITINYNQAQGSEVPIKKSSTQTFIRLVE